jgi:hypothetical protein
VAAVSARFISRKRGQAEVATVSVEGPGLPERRAMLSKFLHHVSKVPTNPRPALAAKVFDVADLYRFVVGRGTQNCRPSNFEDHGFEER